MLPAIERYDGPIFRVLRKHTREAAEDATDTCILSARFGLILGGCLIPRYDRRLARVNHEALCRRVEKQLKQTLDQIQPERLFVSVGSRYWPLLEEALAREVAPSKLVVAIGGIGGRASQLSHWLRFPLGSDLGRKPKGRPGEAFLLGTTLRLGQAEVFQKARQAFVADPVGASRFETWCVLIGRDRVAPKWLVSTLFDKPVARFRTADARRVLSLLGVSCIYAGRH
jgi:hypothetical protein